VLVCARELCTKLRADLIAAMQAPAKTAMNTVLTDHGCVDDNSTSFLCFVQMFITILHHVLDSRSDLHLTHVEVGLHVEMVYQSCPQVEPEI